MKRTVAISIILVLLFNMSGLFVAFKIEQARIRHSIKQQIKAGIPEEELHYFCFSREDYEQLDWVRKNKEFRAGLNMYDVVRSETGKDSVALYCVNDTEETLLFARLDEQVSRKMAQDAHGFSGKVSKLLHLVYTVHPGSIQLAFVLSYDRSAFPEILNTYSSPALECIPQPPDRT